VQNTKPSNLAQLAELSKTRPVCLRVGQLIDGLSDRPLMNADIVFDAMQIRAVAADANIPQRSEPDLILSDCTALPCLIEAHAHLFLDGAPVDFQQREQYLKNSPAWMLQRARQRGPKILQCGIGAVRDAGDRHGVGLALAAERKQYLGKLAPTPWIDSPGPAIHHRGKYGSFMAEPIENFAGPADCIAARVAAGADRIKLLVSGIVNFKAGKVTTPPQMPPDEVAALVRAAQSHGRQTFAHASGTEGIENSIIGGVTTIEHGFFITPDQLAQMRDRQIGWVPTFAPVQLQIDRAEDLGWDQTVVGHLRRIVDSHRAMLRRAHDIGVKIIAGSDAGSCGVPHGLGFLDELTQMQSAGLPPMSILRSATSVSASLLNFPEPIGRLAPGYRARFIVTRHDPLKTVANLQKPRTIFFDGSVAQCDDDMNPQGL
jgi:imidazolonepropionase-like amidohydrolase